MAFYSTDRLQLLIKLAEVLILVVVTYLCTHIILTFRAISWLFLHLYVKTKRVQYNCVV